MEAFLKEGELNLEVTTTYAGFLCIFAAWIIDGSLPWMTGEAPMLQMLSKYLKITYLLPSNTTVYNQLVQIFEELHGKVVHEFAVSDIENAHETNLTHNLGHQVQNCIQHRYVDYTSDGSHIAGTIRCFINNNWKLIEHVVDFKPLAEKDHQELYGGKAFVNGMHEIGGLDKICFLNECCPTKSQQTYRFTSLASPLTMHQ